MSFYHRYNGLGAPSATDERMIAAVNRMNVADANLAATTAAFITGNALKDKLESMDAAWFRTYWEYFHGAGQKAPSEQDKALYGRFATSFPIDTRTGIPDFDATSDALYEARQKAWADDQAAEAAVAAARAEQTAARGELKAAEAAIKNVNKQAEVVVKEAAAMQLQMQREKEVREQKQLEKLANPGPSPLVIAAIAVPVLGAIVYALTRKKSPSVAGYRRRSRR